MRLTLGSETPQPAIGRPQSHRLLRRRPAVRAADAGAERALPAPTPQ